MSHTPGPWRVATSFSGRTTTIKAKDRIFAVAAIEKGKTPEEVACDPPNACLISAAPDLLAACEAAAKEFSEFFPNVCGETLTQVEDAIRKARGEP